VSRDYVAAITAMSACPEALAWLREAGHPGIGSAWRACERADWLLWLAARCEPVRSSAPWSDERKPIVLAAAACAREALPVFEARSPGGARPRQCIVAVEAWCRGEATPGDVRVARRAARAAAVYAASAAVYAASAAHAVYAAAADAAAYAAAADADADAAYAVYAAADAADAAYAVYAAADAADAVYAAASADADADAAADAYAAAARRDCHLRMCAAVRALLPVPVLP